MDSNPKVYQNGRWVLNQFGHPVWSANAFKKWTIRVLLRN